MVMLFRGIYPFQYRNQERQGLSGAGLRCRQNVFSFQRGRDCGRLNRRRNGEMELRQLLLETSRQGHIGKFCQNDLFFLREASREGAVVVFRRISCSWRNVAGESRRYFEAARFCLALENQTEAGKTGDRINCRSDVAYERP